MDPLVGGAVAGGVALGLAAALAVVLAGTAVAVIVGVVALWPKIMDWVRDTARPWLLKNLGAEWVGLFDRAIQVLDGLASALRRKALEAWRTLRPLLREVVVSFLRTQDGAWARVVEVIVRKTLDDPKAIKVTKTEEIDWSEMPDEIRGAALQGEAVPTIQVAKVRDQEAKQTLDLGMGT